MLLTKQSCYKAVCIVIGPSVASGMVVGIELRVRVRVRVQQLGLGLGSGLGIKGQRWG